MKARDVSSMLANNIERVVAELLPNGKRVGHEWKCGSVDGDEGQSMGVHLSGSKAGIWSDFAAGTGGDALDLWMAVRGCGLPEAIDQASAFLGVSIPKPERREYPKPKKIEGVKAVGGNVMAWLTDTRKLLPATIKAYRVGAVGETHVVFPHFRDGVMKNYKTRSIADKKDMRTAAGCEQMLWGWQAIPDNQRTITICEGEIDAMTLYQYGYPALSAFSGAGNLAWIENEFPNLDRFDEIYICFDSDDAGRQGAAKVIERLGRDRCAIVTLPHKDANECLVKGAGKPTIDSAFSGAVYLSPQNLKGSSDFLADVLHLFYPANGDIAGIMMPWPKVMRHVHLRESEMSIWTGISGHGKSQVLGQVMLSAAEQGERICIASMEMKPGRTIQRMVRQALGTNSPTPDEVTSVVQWMQGRIWFYDFVGETSTDALLDVFLYARKRYGVSQFVIDNLMMLDAGEEDLDRQTKAVKKLMAFKSDNNCHIHLVAHARKGGDESKAPRKMDVKGSGNIVNQADNVFSMWRNKPKEENPSPSPNDPDAVLYVDKQRNGEWEGVLPLWFDRSSLCYSDDRDRQAKRLNMVAYDKKGGVHEGEMVEF